MEGVIPPPQTSSSNFPKYRGPWSVHASSKRLQRDSSEAALVAWVVRKDV